MVCLPCCILPIMMVIYMKFIMPYVYRFLPERCVRFLDPILYPTCPMEVPEPEKKKEGNETCCAASNDGEESTKAPQLVETKKEQ